MFNVLPSEGKAVAVQAYRQRLAVVICVGVCVECTLAAVGVYVSYRALLRTTPSSPVTVSAEESAAALESRATAATLVARMEVLSAPPPPSLSEAFVALAAERGGVRLISIAAEMVEAGPAWTRQNDFVGLATGAVRSGGWRIRAQGIADSRETLLGFERRLASRPGFTAVELPVESFAKERALPFTLQALYHSSL
jgi:hypothetical protein